MRRIAWVATIVLLTITGLVILWQFRQALLLFLLSLAAAAAIRPLIDFFTSLRLPRGISLLFSYLVILGSAVGILGLIIVPLVRDIEQATNQFAAVYERIQAQWPESSVPFQRILANQLPPPEELFSGVAVAEGFQSLLGLTTDLTGFFASLGLILILSLYWSADSIHFERLLLSFIAIRQRPTARLIWRAIDKGIGAYIRSELFQSLLAGTLLWLGYRLLGLDYPVLLAVIGSLAWLIPWFGALFAVIPALLVGLGSGILPGILAAVYTVLILVVMEYVIEPRIFWRKNYSSVVQVLVMLVMAEAYGMLGLILAPLVSAGIQIVFKYLLHPVTISESSGLSPGEEPSSMAASLRERLEETRATLQAHPEPLSPEIFSLLQRLESLVHETSQYLDAGIPQKNSDAG